MNRHRRRRRRLAWAAILLMVLAVGPPLDSWASRLFAAHMAQHVVLGLVVGPLLAAAGPGHLLGPAVPVRWRSRARSLRSAASRSTSQLAAAGWVAYLVVLWGWHWPPAYEAALQSSVVHAAEHLSIVAAGFVLWRPLLTWPPARRMPPGPAALHLASAGFHTGLLGALLTFSATPWYRYPADPGVPLSPLADQQVAGAILGTVGLPLFLGALGWTVARAARDQPGGGLREAAA